MKFCRWWAVLPLALVFLLVFASCGSTGIPVSEGGDTQVEEYFPSLRRVYDASENVFFGELLELEILEPQEDALYVECLYTAEVKEVLKGSYRPLDIVQEKLQTGFISKEAAEILDPEHAEEYKGILHIGDQYLFMAGEDSEFTFNPSRPSLSGVEQARFVLRTAPYYKAIRLLPDGRVETQMKTVPKWYRDELRKVPPTTYEEMMELLNTPLIKDAADTDAAPIYACPCEFPDEMIRQGLNALSDPYRSPAGIRERFYCEKHGVDNLKRFENEEQSAD